MSQARPRHRHNVPAARDLRLRETYAEALLWSEVRDRKLAGLKFRRQHPIGPLVVDFCCPDRRLVVELDGGVHAEQAKQDAEREELLRAAGYQMLRFPNQAVRENLLDVLETILRAAERAPSLGSQHISRTSGW